MSADNWAVCPKCEQLEAKEIASLEKGLSNSYGKIPAAQWREQFDNLASRKRNESKQTLREDYEIGIYKGEFDVTYSASCDVCGFVFTFKHKASPFETK